MDKGFKIINQKQLLNNPYMPVWVETCKSGNKTFDYFVLKGIRNSVSIVAFDRMGKLILVNVYRHGARKWFIEPIAGLVEKNEDYTKAAKREMKEETGYSCGKLIKIGEGYSDPSRSIGKSMIYIATNCVKISNQNLDDSEKLEVKLMEPKKVLEKLIKDKNANRWALHAFLLANKIKPELFL